MRIPQPEYSGNIPRPPLPPSGEGARLEPPQLSHPNRPTSGDTADLSPPADIPPPPTHRAVPNIGAASLRREAEGPAVAAVQDSLPDTGKEPPDSIPYPEAASAPIDIAHSDPSDAETIGKIRAANWAEQYARLPGVTAEWMDEQIERIAGEEATSSRGHWIEVSQQPDATNLWLTARSPETDEIIGYLEARRHPDGTQELRSLHLTAESRGRGVGQGLMDQAHQWFNEAEDVILDVAAVNTAGQRFYSRPSNGYEFTDHTFYYGPIEMRQMKRRGTGQGPTPTPDA